jgi:DNA-binding transcriptional regulator GbsR (MarR family)
VNVNLTRQIMIRLSEKPMSLEELVEKTGIEKKQVYRVLSSLHKSRRIIHFRDVDGLRRYKPVEES